MGDITIIDAYKTEVREHKRQVEKTSKVLLILLEKRCQRDEKTSLTVSIGAIQEAQRKRKEAQEEQKKAIDKLLGLLSIDESIYK